MKFGCKDTSKGVCNHQGKDHFNNLLHKSNTLTDQLTFLFG